MFFYNINVFTFQIESLLPLRLNPHYAKLKQLIAPDNQISSMDDLVGSPFVNNKPTTLNLQLNSMKLVSLPFSTKNQLNIYQEV